jgi:hypothetical protein
MIDALVIALLPFVISTVGSFFVADPGGGPAGPQPFVVITTVLVWALSSWSAWRLAALEPIERRLRGPRIVAMILRVAAAAFLVFAACWTALSGRTFDVDVWHASLVFSGTVAAVAFYLRVRHVALRIGMPGLGGQALMMAVLVPSVLLAVRFVGSSGMFTITPTTGWAGILRYVFPALVRWDWDDWEDVLRLVSWPFLLTICQVAVLVQLLVALIRTRRHAVNAEG